MGKSDYGVWIERVIGNGRRADPDHAKAGRYAFFEADVVDPAGTGPMIPEHETPAREKLGGEDGAKETRVRAGATG